MNYKENTEFSKLNSESHSFDLTTTTFLCKNDSLVNLVMSLGKKNVVVREVNPKPDIYYSSGYSENQSYTNYNFLVGDINYEFTQVYHSNRKKRTATRKAFLNKEQLVECPFENEKFILDSMEIQIDYTESEIYYFTNSPNHLLIVSHPMNWVGKMTQYSFFQIINHNDKIIAEFVRLDP